MSLRRRSALLGICLMLSACASSGPTGSVLSPESQGSVVIQSVSVDSGAMGETTDGQQVPTSSVVRLLEEEAQRLVGRGEGSTPTRLMIELESVNLISAAQSAMIGGESIMKGTVSLVDARNGRVIIPPQSIDSGGGGWVMGGLIGAATRDDPATELRQLSREFIDRAGVLVFGV